MIFFNLFPVIENDIIFMVKAPIKIFLERINILYSGIPL